VDGTTATSPRSPGKADALERVLRRPDLVVLGGVTALAAVAWADLFRRGDMMCADTPWLWSELGMAIVMWSVMMVAMMLPSATPMTMIFARLQRQRRAAGQAATPVTLFVAGYLLVWTGFSIAAAILQWALQSTLIVSMHLTLENTALAGAFLVVAGLYQLTPLKTACLAHCQSPIGFIAGHWRDGWLGALDMGVRHGAYCVGCCWALMCLLFVFGVMNLAWVAALSGYVLAEKVIPWLAASRLVGLALIVWGSWIALAA
jgi:predicted metal-binding membrane protein